jgi:hypothetical protein
MVRPLLQIESTPIFSPCLLELRSGARAMTAMGGLWSGTVKSEKSELFRGNYV